MSSRMKKVAALLGVLLLTVSTVFAGCGSSKSSSSSSGQAAVETLNYEDMFTDRDLDPDYSEEDAKTITLADDASSSDEDSVTIDGNTITITKEGIYEITGSLSNGQIIVDAEDSKVQLVFKGASIAATENAAIYVKEADKVFVTLAEGTENSLSSTGEFTADGDTNVDGCIFSKADLTINGSGSLTVTSDSGNGIVSKDDLRVTGGTLTVDADNHAIEGKDSVRIADGSLTLTAGKDGLHSENTDDISKGFVYIAGGTITMACQDDGIDSSSLAQIDGGTITIAAGDGSTQSGFAGTMPGQSSTDSASQDSSTQDSSSQDNSSSQDSSQTQPGGNGGTMTPPSGSDSTVTPPSGGNMPQAPGQTDDSTQDSSDSTDKTDTSKSDSSDSDSTTDQKKSFDKSGKGGQMGGSGESNGSSSKGIQAEYEVYINGGTITVSQSYEGIEGAVIVVDDGEINVTASDDGFNAAGGDEDSNQRNEMEADDNNWITINGGTITINAQGDGVDSNGDLTVTGGSLYVSGPTSSANAAIDYAGNATITGGTVIAAGASGMAESFGSDSTQCAMLVEFTSSTTEALTLTDSDGNVVLTYQPTSSYNSVVISSPDIEKGSTYTLTCGSETTTVEMTDTIYGQGNGMGGGGFGGGFSHGGH